jgi:alpha-glucosidase
MVPLTSPGNYPDLGRADVRAAWGQQYTYLINDVGIDMVWQDMMCPALDGNKFANGTFPLTLMVNNGETYVPNGAAHNCYSLFLAMATWEGLIKLRPGIRNFIIARGGYAGIQRYAALWTGDSASSWDFLALNLPEVLNLGLSGVPISGCDIGGFADSDGNGNTAASYDNGIPTGNITNYELLTRWMHLGAFLPWYRNHYNGYIKAFQEPYRYGEPVPTNCRKYIELRYRMLQLHYDALYEWTQTGMPIARALFLNDAGDPQVYQHLDDQFFVGRDVLVAPILFPGQGVPPIAKRSVYLPAGSDWYSFKDNTAPLDAAVAGGGAPIPDYYAGLDLVPIYIRAGAILPMRSQVEQYVGQLPQNPLDITAYPGPDRDYLLYQDDGTTTQAQTAGVFRTTLISQQTTVAGRIITLARQTDKYIPAEPYVLVRLLQMRAPSAVLVGGARVAQLASADALGASAVDGYYVDATTVAVVVKVIDTRPTVSVEVRF